MFNELAKKLGIQNVQFEDIYSIDKDSFESLSPLYGIIFLFKYGRVDRMHAEDGNRPIDGEYDKQYQDKGIFFANQTIQNACGTQAILNVLLNVPGLNVGDELSNFKSFVEGFDGEMSGSTISNSELIRAAHNSFSPPALFVDEDKNQPPPDQDDKDDGLFHFIGYMNIHGRIYELDGLKSFPIVHETCNSQDEFFDKLPNVLGRRIAKYGNELRFTLLGITRDRLEYFKEIGDNHGIEQELSKREAWKKENESRRHDHLGLLVQLVKEIGKLKSDEEWNLLLDKAKKKGQERLFDNIKKLQQFKDQ